jgi:hypothetical protein
MTIRIDIAIDGYPTTRHDEDGAHECWQETFAIVAEHADGRRWQWGDSFPSMAIAKSVLRNVDVGVPSADDTWGAWMKIETRYGSDAWGDEDEYKLACFEADCFNEPRPRW